MQNFVRSLLVFALTISAAVAQGRIGVVNVDVDKNTVPVRVSASVPELNALVQQAFGVHGRYRQVASGYAFDIRFSSAGAQVRVDITQGSAGTPVASRTFAGETPRVALLRAADFAVEQTNGLGLHGFFTARLAFVGERTGKKEIYVSDLFLGESQQVTRDRALVLTPRWSPDGSRLIYTSYFKSGFPDIFLYNVKTYERQAFASYRGTNSGARFSPDGRQVALVATAEGRPEIFVSGASGLPIARRTRSDKVKSSPCWSPDGTRLVFAMEDGPQLYVMPAAGGTPQRLVTGSTYAAEPDWSRRNPSKIACTIRDGVRYQIAVYDFAQGRAAKVSSAPFDAIEAAWLDDGRHLVYTARDRSSSVLCILDTETGKSTPISSGFGPSMQASVWTP
jgi:TolB protein